MSRSRTRANRAGGVVRLAGGGCRRSGSRRSRARTLGFGRRVHGEREYSFSTCYSRSARRRGRGRRPCRGRTREGQRGVTSTSPVSQLDRRASARRRERERGCWLSRRKSPRGKRPRRRATREGARRTRRGRRHGMRRDGRLRTRAVGDAEEAAQRMRRGGTTENPRHVIRGKRRAGRWGNTTLFVTLRRETRTGDGQRPGSSATSMRFTAGGMRKPSRRATRRGGGDDRARSADRSFPRAVQKAERSWSNATMAGLCGEFRESSTP